MSDNSKIALGVAGGYLLGRTKKMKLALSLGGLLIGQKIPTNPRELLKQGQKLVQGNENLSEIDEMLRGNLLEAARAAALATLSSRMNSVSDSIRERTDGLRELAKTSGWAVLGLTLQGPFKRSEPCATPSQRSTMNVTGRAAPYSGPRAAGHSAASMA